MKTKAKMKKDGKDFERFDDLLKTVIKVPKEEINRREQADKEKKECKKETA